MLFLDGPIMTYSSHFVLLMHKEKAKITFSIRVKARKLTSYCKSRINEAPVRISSCCG